MLRHSAIAHAAYHDLLRLLKDEAASGLRGTPTAQSRNGRVYWYDSYRVGTAVKKTYIGEDSPELRQRLERARALKAEAKERRAARNRLVRLLRAEGFLSTDQGSGSLLNAMAQAGTFRLGGTVVGTQAFRLYEGELGVRLGFDDSAQTDDLDIASFERLSLALDDRADPPLGAVLADFRFDPVPALDNLQAWRWSQSKSGTLVEFLTPAFGQEGLRPLAALEVRAQALHYLNYLIAEPITAAVLYRSGVLVQIPRPERFAIHKLIVSTRRHGADALKAEKDRRQARFLIGVLAEDRPDDLWEAYEDARGRGPRWGARLDQALERMPELRAQLEALEG
ncbi:nucleotidyltransferase family protein [Pseudodonghicola flavimaris]|uniref:GSU2403 family nucleotidyltransferase fold protein n=1 Tax=Pseudodonghicola flavimaris TaxID=3050036 RepID=A0ABT7F873_9RHOB|nr:GSU2403 family nucleotidyltransferase fold protein [Pseudodonghicola flavimaris]MDK3020818.1 GSU2403 family nucleotidyltransferase fold protein [Pseudodonghicola flavimaris]